MIVIALIVGLFALLMLASRHAGPAHLAAIAGVAVNEMFGGQVVNFISGLSGGLSAYVISTSVYIALVLGFPILLYLKSAKERRSVLRTVKYAIYAVLMAGLIVLPFADIVAVDELGRLSTSIVEAILPFMLAVGVATSYIDILRYKNHSKSGA